MRSFSTACVAVLLVGAAVAPPALRSQGATGRILGTAADPSGATVAVRVVNQGTGESRAATTDQTGSYLFSSLLVGVYRLEAPPGWVKPLMTTETALIIMLAGIVLV